MLQGSAAKIIAKIEANVSKKENHKVKEMVNTTKFVVSTSFKP